MSFSAAALVLALLGFAMIVGHAYRNRELFVLSVRGGRVSTVRGRIPQSLLDALSDVFERAQVQSATVKAVREGGYARVVATGLDELVLQRARNVVGTYPLQKIASAPPRRSSLLRLVGK